MRVDQFRRGGALPGICVLGSTGRVAGLLRSAWQRMDYRREISWVARRDDPAGNVRVVADFRDPVALAPAIPQGSVVLVLAGVVPGSDMCFSDNSAIAIAAGQAAQARGCRHLFLMSSAAVYGDAPGRLSEDGRPRPVSDYGRAKTEMEAAVLARRHDWPPVTILRLGNLAGADQVLGNARGDCEARLLDVLPDGNNIQRSYIGPVALAATLTQLVENAASGRGLPEIMNVALPGTIGIRELLEADGQGWQPRSAPKNVIARVELDVTRLQAQPGVELPVASADQLVADLNLIRGL